MVGTYGSRQADAAANYRMQNPYSSIGLSDRAAANRMCNGGGASASSSGSSKSTKTTPSSTNSSRFSIDTQMWKDLQTAGASGRGITKDELKKIVTAHAKDGKIGVLSKSEKNALNRAIERGMFAHSSTSQAAKNLVAGKPLSTIGVRLI